MNRPILRKSRYAIGEVIEHRCSQLRGVIVDIDAVCQAESLESIQKTVDDVPSVTGKDRPWYYILLQGEIQPLYVAEFNLRKDFSGKKIRHPFVPLFFSEFHDGKYKFRRRPN